jgi:hypothetical protein
MIVHLTLASSSGPDSLQKHYLFGILTLFNCLLQILDVGIQVAIEVILKSELSAVAPVESHNLCDNHQYKLKLLTVER